mmetsp:Transcript_1135/g.2439  ORF Transcript_1135/g.2439 Transcript_1135/m.2439 type:complete len:367 (+) Transcript_1135:1781-2881(+)
MAGPAEGRDAASAKLAVLIGAPCPHLATCRRRDGMGHSGTDRADEGAGGRPTCEELQRPTGKITKAAEGIVPEGAHPLAPAVENARGSDGERVVLAAGDRFRGESDVVRVGQAEAPGRGGALGGGEDDAGCAIDRTQLAFEVVAPRANGAGREQGQGVVSACCDVDDGEVVRGGGGGGGGFGDEGLGDPPGVDGLHGLGGGAATSRPAELCSAPLADGVDCIRVGGEHHRMAHPARNLTHRRHPWQHVRSQAVLRGGAGGGTVELAHKVASEAADSAVGEQDEGVRASRRYSRRGLISWQAHRHGHCSRHPPHIRRRAPEHHGAVVEQHEGEEVGRGERLDIAALRDGGHWLELHRGSVSIVGAGD